MTHVRNYSSLFLKIHQVHDFWLGAYLYIFELAYTKRLSQPSLFTLQAGSIMSIPFATQLAAEQMEAVFLFNGDQLAREMLYSEFGAILDGFIPMPEYAGKAAKAVYVHINSHLCITAAVFFVVEFDGRGMIERRWNVPLQQLADAASRGPDLGAGAIRLACFSQCPIEWQRNNLWDPQMQPGRNSFVLMRKAVKANRLGLIFKTAAADKATALEAERRSHEQKRDQKLQEKLRLHYAQELRNRVAQVIKEQRLRITTLVNLQKEKTQRLQQEHQQRLQAYQQTLNEHQQQIQELENRNQTLKESLGVQLQKIEGVREYFTHKLKAAQLGEGSQLRALQENYSVELEARVKAATTELQEKLDMREVELFYRHQQENSLRDEVAYLRQENANLLSHSGDHLLSRLSKVGINFVAFHPGAGNMTIGLDEVSRYLDNPGAFAAAKCGVSEAHYEAWLQHNRAPVCTAADQHGKPCNHLLKQIESPTEFHPGESDRCDAHQSLLPQKTARIF